MICDSDLNTTKSWIYIQLWLMVINSTDEGDFYQSLLCEKSHFLHKSIFWRIWKLTNLYQPWESIFQWVKNCCAIGKIIDTTQPVEETVIRQNIDNTYLLGNKNWFNSRALWTFLYKFSFKKYLFAKSAFIRTITFSIFKNPKLWKSIRWAEFTCPFSCIILKSHKS